MDCPQVCTNMCYCHSVLVKFLEKHNHHFLITYNSLKINCSANLLITTAKVIAQIYFRYSGVSLAALPRRGHRNVWRYTTPRFSEKSESTRYNELDRFYFSLFCFFLSSCDPQQCMASVHTERTSIYQFHKSVCMWLAYLKNRSSIDFTRGLCIVNGPEEVQRDLEMW